MSVPIGLLGSVFVVYQVAHLLSRRYCSSTPGENGYRVTDVIRFSESLKIGISLLGIVFIESGGSLVRAAAALKFALTGQGGDILSEQSSAPVVVNGIAGDVSKKGEKSRSRSTEGATGPRGAAGGDQQTGSTVETKPLVSQTGAVAATSVGSSPNHAGDGSESSSKSRESAALNIDQESPKDVDSISSAQATREKPPVVGASATGASSPVAVTGRRDHVGSSAASDVMAAARGPPTKPSALLAFATTVLPVGAPALLYTIQNVLQLIAASCVDAVTFILPLQSKIIFATFLGVFILGRKLPTWTQIFALHLIAIAIFVVSRDEDDVFGWLSAVFLGRAPGVGSAWIQDGLRFSSNAGKLSSSEGLLSPGEDESGADRRASAVDAGGAVVAEGRSTTSEGRNSVLSGAGAGPFVREAGAAGEKRQLLPGQQENSGCPFVEDAWLRPSDKAILLVLCCAFISGLAGVLTEKLLAQTKVGFWTRNLQLAGFSLLVISITISWKDGGRTAPPAGKSSAASPYPLPPFLGDLLPAGFTLTTLWLVWIEASIGLFSGLLIKRFGIVQKDVLQCLTIVSCSIFGYILLSELPKCGIFLNALAVVLAGSGVFLYSSGKA